MDTNWIVQEEGIYFQAGMDAFCARWNPDDSVLAVACGDGTVKLFNVNTGSFTRVLNCRQTLERLPVASIRWRPEIPTAKTKNVLLAGTSDGAVLHWHATSGKLLHTILLPDNQALALDYSEDATQFAVGCKDATVRVYDEATKHIRAELSGGFGEKGGHSNKVFSVKFKGENLLISGGWDNSTLVWDLRAGEVIANCFGQHVCGDSIDVRGDTLLIGGYHPENQLQLWSLMDYQNIHTESIITRDRACMVYAAQFSKCNQATFFAIGGAGGNDLYFYKSERLERFHQEVGLNDAVFSIDWANDLQMCAVSYGEAGVKTYHVVDASVLDAETEVTDNQVHSYQIKI